ncbi:MAG: BamA/TamA family outer membrane protein [Bacteroidetes bacterium]|nr:BamA/TamA family outer membrane protein [Bacteroidota bacterium]MDA0902764.1 BamA/TamA family outer membrane protein [Bacteroidota bacterium]MDA1242901.1 BamA/TamA family outer membrane protein [Bacteroidota bacterium]
MAASYNWAVVASAQVDISSWRNIEIELVVEEGENPSKSDIASWKALLPQQPRSNHRRLRPLWGRDRTLNEASNSSMEESWNHEEIATINATALQRRLQQGGWLQANVLPSWRPQRRGHSLVLTMQVGPRWHVGTVNMIGDGTGLPVEYLKGVSELSEGMPFEMTALREAKERIASAAQDRGLATFHSGLVELVLDTLTGLQATANLEVRLLPWSARNLPWPASWPDSLRPVGVLPHREVTWGDVTWDGQHPQSDKDRIGGIRGEVWRHSMAISPGHLYHPKHVSDTYERLSGLAAVDKVYMSQTLRWESEASSFVQDTLSSPPPHLVMDMDCSLSFKSANDISLELDMIRNNARSGPRLAATLLSRNQRGWGAEGRIQSSFGYVAVAPFSSFSSQTLLNSGEWSLNWRRSRTGMVALPLDAFRPSARPRSTLDVGWNREVWPEFTRSEWHANHDVQWIENPSRGSVVSIGLLQASVVNLGNRDSAFVSWLEAQNNPLILARFNNHATLGSFASWESSWNVGAWRGNTSVLANWAGMAPQWAAEQWGRALKFDEVTGAWMVAPGVPLVQHQRVLFTTSGARETSYQAWSVAWQIRFGAARAGRNTASLPLEQSFFSGGSNGTRGWVLRSLGPGTFNASSQTGVIQGLGDMRLDLQFESRWEVSSSWSLAWFVDAGNVWLQGDGVPDFARWQGIGARSLALGSGLGVRYDLDFFVLRLDGGLRLHDPTQLAGSRWMGSEGVRGAMHFGLGLPF